jgi:hypothetical protein
MLIMIILKNSFEAAFLLIPNLDSNSSIDSFAIEVFRE